MCIAIYLPAGKEITKSILKECNKSNPHGFGYAYFNEENKMQVIKTVKNVNQNINYFLKIRKANIEKPFILHFRIATHGKIITKCCHPFKVNENLVFCHNGILEHKYTKDLTMKDDKSDSMLFGETMLAKLPINFMENEAKKELLDDHIGAGNKMILLNAEGKHWILNENSGYWDDGIWYSNRSYQKVVYHSYGGTGLGAVDFLKEWHRASALDNMIKIL